MRYFILLLAFILSVAANAQQTTTVLDNDFQPFIQRLTAFGEKISQEKVFVHMDNTCYFLGDTIWFAAYTRQTNTDSPSNISGVLYVELLNDDGYLMERKIVEMKEGNGNGFFHLRTDRSYYGGFYELRAYTRWQLNWGEFEHRHTFLDKGWFFNNAMRHDFFRDYDKLYSRVFPVYDKPKESGKYYLEMTSRPFQRNYSKDESVPKLSLSLFPEGGNLVAGVENRVAFEAAWNDGEQLEGTLSVDGKEIPVVNRGRGMFTITPEKGMEREVTFTTKDGQTVKAKLPKPEEQGVAVQVSQEGEDIIITANLAGLSPDSLALTVMHEGKVEEFKTLSAPSPREGADTNPTQKVIQIAPSPRGGQWVGVPGIHQLTIFDTQGRVWADRLFFVTKQDMTQPTLAVSGLKDEYKPYEKIEMKVEAPSPDPSRGKGGFISLSVFDINHGNGNFDNGNIMTEMLLASEIKGFIPNPGWYFEKDDKEHRQALDLLMMTQGWRRFVWKDMAVKGEWEFTQPAEKTPIIIGAVHKYTGAVKYGPLRVEDMRLDYQEMGMDPDVIEESIKSYFDLPDKRGQRIHRGKDLKTNKRADSLQVSKELKKRMTVDGEKLRHEVKVHCEWGRIDNPNTIQTEAVTKDGRFMVQLPRAYGRAEFHIAASDTTKWSKKEKRREKRHVWYVSSEEEYPEYYVRLSYPYPHFVKPYDYYQKNIMPRSIDDSAENREQQDVHTLRIVNVGAKSGAFLKDMFMKPAVKMDAYDAFNAVADAGLMNAWYSSSEMLTIALARYHVADMGVHNRYLVWKRLGNIYGNVGTQFMIHGKSPRMAEVFFNQLSNLDSIYIYTDYSPRMEGDRRYRASNMPNVGVVFKPGFMRPTYRDRCIKMHGFSYPAEFYSPNYSKQTPPEPTDYRRTLYWNPNLKLDENGKAQVTLYNNSRTTKVTVEAEGQTADGGLLWNK